MSFTSPPLNRNASTRQATAARTSHHTQTVPQYTIDDALELTGHMAGAVEYYRDKFLPSTFGVLVQRVLEESDNRFNKAIRTGDLEHVVNLK